ncbi:MAG: AI-2E family transporter [Bacteroidales bacterium]|nr:AI-2E family transporter [Bacteroidales bacterium]
MPNSWSQPYTFDRVVRLVITILIILGAVWLINVLKSVLLPFCVACLVAYIFEPFVQYNRRILRLKGRIIAIFVTLFEATTIFGILCWFFIPSIVEETQQMAVLLRRYAETEMDVPFLPEGMHHFLKRIIDFNYLSDVLTTQDIERVLERALAVLSSGVDIIMGVFSWFIVLLYVVFIMLDYDRLMEGFRMLVPPKYRKVTFKIGRDIKTSMNHYFRGQALVAFIVGILFSIGFLIVGLPLAVVLGLFIGLLNMVPYLQLISIIPTTLLCLVYSVDHNAGFWAIWWECIAVYCIVQLIQDLFLTPKIMGKAMGLNPAIILLSLSVWGTLLGLIGLIIALPLTTLLIAYYDQYVLHRPRDGFTPEDRHRQQEDLHAITRFPDD